MTCFAYLAQSLGWIPLHSRIKIGNLKKYTHNFKKKNYDETLDIFYLRFIFVYQKYLNERRTFETDFWVQNHLLEFFLVLTVHRGYFVFKISKTYVKCCNNCNEKPVLKLRSKDFWYTNYSSMETALVKICPKGLLNTIIKAL